MKQIVLASASPRRRELLAQAGIVFTVKASDAEEVVTENAPDKIVKELAFLKAKAVAEREEDALVIGADTIVAAEGNILGKPHSREEAFSMLSMLQGKTHQVYTGVALIAKEAGKERLEVFAEKTDVTFYPMTEKRYRNILIRENTWTKQERMESRGALRFIFKKSAATTTMWWGFLSRNCTRN